MYYDFFALLLVINASAKSHNHATISLEDRHVNFKQLLLQNGGYKRHFILF